MKIEHMNGMLYPPMPAVSAYALLSSFQHHMKNVTFLGGNGETYIH